MAVVASESSELFRVPERFCQINSGDTRQANSISVLKQKLRLIRRMPRRWLRFEAARMSRSCV